MMQSLPSAPTKPPPRTIASNPAHLKRFQDVTWTRLVQTVMQCYYKDRNSFLNLLSLDVISMILSFLQVTRAVYHITRGSLRCPYVEQRFFCPSPWFIGRTLRIPDPTEAHEIYSRCLDKRMNEIFAPPAARLSRWYSEGNSRFAEHQLLLWEVRGCSAARAEALCSWCFGAGAFREHCVLREVDGGVLVWFIGRSVPHDVLELENLFPAFNAMAERDARIQALSSRPMGSRVALP